METWVSGMERPRSHFPWGYKNVIRDCNSVWLWGKLVLILRLCVAPCSVMDLKVVLCSFSVLVALLWFVQRIQSQSDFVLHRVEITKAQSLCGHPGMGAAHRTHATATATPTASTPCPSRQCQNTAPSPGTLRSALPPWPPPTAVEPTMKSRL